MRDDLLLHRLRYFWRQLENGGCECSDSCPGFKEMEPEEKRDSGLLEVD